MTPAHRNWSAGPWVRFEPVTDPESGAYRGETAVEGAVVSDEPNGVAYKVTLNKTPTGPTLRTLEVVPLDGQPIDQPMLRRVPVATLAAYVAKFLALQERHARAERNKRVHGRSSDVLTLARPGGIELPGDAHERPTDEQVADWLRAGETRSTIAELTGKSPSTVDDWIRRARRLYPDLPQARRGRRPARTTTTEERNKE
jgi:hypothetical protein